MSLYCLHYDELRPCERLKRKSSHPLIYVNSQNTKSVPLLLLYSVVIYCALFCFSVARSDLSETTATFVFEMVCFNKGSVFQ